jgi:hypothetical protein
MLVKEKEDVKPSELSTWPSSPRHLRCGISLYALLRYLFLY